MKGVKVILLSMLIVLCCCCEYKSVKELGYIPVLREPTEEEKKAELAEQNRRLAFWDKFFKDELPEGAVEVIPELQTGCKKEGGYWAAREVGTNNIMLIPY